MVHMSLCSLKITPKLFLSTIPSLFIKALSQIKFLNVYCICELIKPWHFPRFSETLKFLKTCHFSSIPQLYQLLKTFFVMMYVFFKL